MLRPFFSYYGSKWRDSPRLYPKPIYKTIIEPFAGSAGYSLRYPEHDVLLVDADPVIAGVWKYLITADESEILGLPDVKEGQRVSDLDIPEQAKWLIGFWLNHGSAAPAQQPSAWMRKGTHDSSFWGESIRKRIASQQSSIRHWQVSLAKYNAIPNFSATWFIDPPYEGAGKHYKMGSSLIDYNKLGEWCKARDGQVIVCENSGASWLPFKEVGNTKTSRKDKTSSEAVWIKGFNG